jgi:hypothetical protein
MPRRFLYFAVVCGFWWIALVAILQPVDAMRMKTAFEPESALPVAERSGYDYYRSNEDIHRDAVLRQRRDVASAFLAKASGRLDWFVALAVGPAILGFFLTAVAGWLPSFEERRARAAQAARDAAQRRARLRGKPRYVDGRRVY